jgi:hypothetical protein
MQSQFLLWRKLSEERLAQAQVVVSMREGETKLSYFAKIWTIVSILSIPQIKI